jgi:hypothetical protein
MYSRRAHDYSDLPDVRKRTIDTASVVANVARMATSSAYDRRGLASGSAFGAARSTAMVTTKLSMRRLSAGWPTGDHLRPRLRCATKCVALSCPMRHPSGDEPAPKSTLTLVAAPVLP